MEQQEHNDEFFTPQVRLPFPDLLCETNRQAYLDFGIPLYQACLKGDWQAASRICNTNQACLTASITKQRDCALHIAAAARHTHIVQGLVGLMLKFNQIENLALQNCVGNTALCLAAASDTVSSAKVMVEAYGDRLPPLHMIRGNSGLMPLHMAALLGHREMVYYLLSLNNNSLYTDQQLPALLISTINAELYDVALSILFQHPELAIAKDEHQENPLHVLARKSRKLPPSRIYLWSRCLDIFKNRYGGLTEQNLQPLALELVSYLWNNIIKRNNLAEIEELMGPSWEVLFVAVRAGNVEFLTVLIRAYPDLIWKFDDKCRSIFHVAVQYRQEEIFNLIYQIGAVKNLLAMYTDEDNNSMLHYAAMLPSSDRLNCVSGAALQMQREMMWFKVVGKLMQPQIAEAKNFWPESDDEMNPQIAETSNLRGKTARELFSEEHKELRKEGEEWMRKTASSCSVVSTLIAGVAFGAALKVPGGDNTANTLGHGALYLLLAVSDSLSLISSTASIFIFLSILM